MNPGFYAAALGFTQAFKAELLHIVTSLLPRTHLMPAAQTLVLPTLPAQKLPVVALATLLSCLHCLPVAAETWQFEVGVATLSRQQPWLEIEADHQLLPMLSARYGNWQFGTSQGSLLSYSWQFPAEFKLQLGVGVRDLGYGAKTQTNKKLSRSTVFQGYRIPDPEAVFDASLYWRWFFLQFGQQLNDDALALQAKAGVQLPLWQHQRGARLALQLEARYLNQHLSQRIYGVDADNQNWQLGRPQFVAPSAINPAISLQLSYPFANQWLLLAVLSNERLDDKLHQSPLLGKDQITELLLAVNYRF